MAQYLNRKYTFLEFLSDSTPISSLNIFNKIKTIYKIQNSIVQAWEHDSNFNSFTTLEPFVTYFFINKNVEPSQLLLHSNTNLQSANNDITHPLQIIQYKGECPSIPITSFNNKIQKIYSINSDGTSFNAWTNTSKFNTLNNIITNNTYLVYSFSQYIPFTFGVDPVYSVSYGINLLAKCDTFEYSSYLSSVDTADKCSSEILSDNLNKCVSNTISIN